MSIDGLEMTTSDKLEDVNANNGKTEKLVGVDKK